MLKNMMIGFIFVIFSNFELNDDDDDDFYYDKTI